ncbi:MAG: hypothetical protein J6P57_05855 [Lachnospiraceae bacterium]|nr:hypothetical protein [Lachnospiraceae bacterium]
MKKNELKKMFITVSMAAVMSCAISGCGKEEKKDKTTGMATTAAATNEAATTAAATTEASPAQTTTGETSGQTATTEAQVKEDTADSNTTVASEKKEEVAVTNTFEGTYHETLAGRGTINIKKDTDTNYTVEISWAGSAAEMSDWVCHPTLQDGKLIYDDCVQTYTIFDENGNPTTDDEGVATPVIVYEGGKGSFSFNNDGNLVWDDQTEHVADDSVFAK